MSVHSETHGTVRFSDRKERFRMEMGDGGGVGGREYVLKPACYVTGIAHALETEKKKSVQLVSFFLLSKSSH